MGTKQPLCFSIAWVCRGRRLLWWVCLGGQGAGSSVVSGGTVKQRSRQMKALPVLKSNHNLVISRRWYDENKDGNRRGGQDRERPECTSQDEGMWDCSEMGNDGASRTEMVLFLKLMLICCIRLDIQARALTLKGFQKLCCSYIALTIHEPSYTCFKIKANTSSGTGRLFSSIHIEVATVRNQKVLFL